MEPVVSSEHHNEVLTGAVGLDHGVFVGCTFRKATLIYTGVGATRIDGCKFEDAKFVFDGPAANALAFLRAMAAPGSGLRDVLKASFPHIFGH